ncbi:hypothetical protein COA18_04370 [Priestia megaterium]|nr:hypothetical protein COA18_04370 [Priestia megaterium]
MLSHYILIIIVASLLTCFFIMYGISIMLDTKRDYKLVIITILGFGTALASIITAIIEIRKILN